MTVYIYGLHCPIAQQIRYIGKAVEPKLRLQQHLATCKRRKTYRDHWLCELRAAGSRPSIVILRELSDADDWCIAEREEIAKGRELGWPLTNLTEGGDGVLFTPEARARHLEAARRPDRRKRISEGRKRFLADPTERSKVGENNRRRACDPEAKARQAAALKRYWSDPQRSAAHRASIKDAKRLERQSKAMKQRWADPEYRARLSAAHRKQS